MSSRHAYEPDHVIAPGEILEEILGAIGMTPSELARRCLQPERLIREILHAKSAITSETAIRLERVLDRPTSFWLQLQSQYDVHRASPREDDAVATRGLGRIGSRARNRRRPPGARRAEQGNGDENARGPGA